MLRALYGGQLIGNAETGWFLRDGPMPWVGPMVTGNFTAPGAVELVALVGGQSSGSAEPRSEGDYLHVRWVLLGQDPSGAQSNTTRESWLVVGRSPSLGFNLPKSEAPWEVSALVDFDRDGRQELLASTSSSARPDLANELTHVFRWDGESFTQVWTASTYDDVTGATSAPVYYTYEAQVAFGEADGIPELRLDGTIRYFGKDGQGQVDTDTILGDELIARRFRWDGTRFSEFSAVGPAMPFTFTDVSGLWLWDGGQVRQLDERMVDSLAWSPEGQLLAYEAWWPADEQGIWLYDVETEKTDRIAPTEANIYTLRWSPDGGTLAYSLAHPPAIWLYRLDSEAQTELAANAERLSWAPDGEQLAYAERGNLVRYDLVSQAAIVLVTAPKDDGSLPRPGAYRPVWSQRSDLIACAIVNAGQERPMLVSASLPGPIDATAPSNLIADIAAGRIDVYWSPQGDRLAILAANPEAPNQASAIYVVEVPARWAGDTPLEPKQLTHVDKPGQPVSPPAWSPDGGRLAAVVGAEIWVWDVESGAAQSWHAFPVSLEENAVTWSPDGSGFLIRQGERIHWFVTDAPGDPVLLVQRNGLDQVEFQPR